MKINNMKQFGKQGKGVSKLKMETGNAEGWTGLEELLSIRHQIKELKKNAYLRSFSPICSRSAKFAVVQTDL